MTLVAPATAKGPTGRHGGLTGDGASPLYMEKKKKSYIQRRQQRQKKKQSEREMESEKEMQKKGGGLEKVGL